MARNQAKDLVLLFTGNAECYNDSGVSTDKSIVMYFSNNL